MRFETKYAPANLSEYIYPDQTAKAKVDLYIQNQMDGNLLLHGKYGSGKTTLAGLIPLSIVRQNDPNCQHVWYQHKAGYEVLIDELKKLKDQASMVHPQLPKQLIVIDEADMMSPKAMEATKKVMDDTKRSCSFIFCTNHIDKIEGGIKSRCVGISFDRSDVSAIFKRASHILAQENVVLPKANIMALIEKSGGDFRNLLQELEAICFSVHGKNAA